MATLGRDDLKQYALPTYWDPALLRRMELEAGYTYEQVLSDITGALAMANASLLADPLISSLISVTTEVATEYAIGVAADEMQAHTEYSRPDQHRGATTGHMLPLTPYDDGLGWTWDFLRKARRIQIDTTVAGAIRRLRNTWAKQILTRLFKSTYTAVGTGRSMPLADGGTADSTYIPVAVAERGGTFLYTHDHIEPLDGITQANLETAVLDLWEHGYDAPYDLLVSATDIADWSDTSDVTGWIPKASPTIRYGMTADLADLGEDFIGAIDTNHGICRVRANGRVPTTYWSLYKSAGALDQRNPLVVRYNPAFGIGGVPLAAKEAIRQYPFEDMIIFAEFGVGVADRVGAVVVKNTSSTYSDPTIT